MRTGLRLRCVVRGSERIYGEVQKGDERCFISLEEEEETIEEEANEERTSVGVGSGG